MVPIYDTDLAEDRFDKNKWENYELWEKVEARIRRNKRLWIFGTGILVLILFSIPILAEQKPRRTSLSAIRQLADVIGKMKLDASVQHVAMRLSFSNLESLEYQVGIVENCQAPSFLTPEKVQTARLVLNNSQTVDSSPMLLDPKKGEEIGVPGLTTDFCYDSLAGNHAVELGTDPVGFAIIPSADLPIRRFDRMSILVLSGSSAEISFE